MAKRARDLHQTRGLFISAAKWHDIHSNFHGTASAPAVSAAARWIYPREYFAADTAYLVQRRPLAGAKFIRKERLSYTKWWNDASSGIHNEFVHWHHRIMDMTFFAIYSVQLILSPPSSLRTVSTSLLYCMQQCRVENTGRQFFIRGDIPSKSVPSRVPLPDSNLLCRRSGFYFNVSNWLWLGVLERYQEWLLLCTR